MPSKKTRLKKTQPSNVPTTEVDSLLEYAREAELVSLMTRQPGWEILERDINEYKNQIGEKIAYLPVGSKEFEEARVLFIASDKLLKMIFDYAENRKRALELIERLENTDKNIVLDVDN